MIVEDWNDIVMLEVNYPESNIRVKHLDREDIESLGFSIVQDETDSQWFKNDLLNTEIGIENNHITIRIAQSFVLFSGTIKNKSELKRILKQIGV
jgi:hypothetical protein